LDEEYQFDKVLKGIEGEDLFDSFKPDEHQLTETAGLYVDSKKLDEVEREFAEQGLAVPKRLQEALDQEREALVRHRLGAEENEVDLLNLDAFKEELYVEDEEAGENELGERLYKEVVKPVVEYYDNDGVVTMTHGGLNNMLASLVQCLLVVKPLKDYLVERRYLRVRNSDPKLVKIITEVLSRIFREASRPQLGYLQVTEINLKSLEQQLVKIFPVDSNHNVDSVLAFVLQRLEVELTPVDSKGLKSDKVADEADARALALTKDLFSNNHIKKMRCERKHNLDKGAAEQFLSLHLKDDLDSALHSYYKKRDTQLACKECGTRVKGTKSYKA
jgi:hypothetical protein